MELDRGQIGFVFSVEGVVTLELAFSATLDAVPRPLFSAHYHSLLRLKDAYRECFKCHGVVYMQRALLLPFEEWLQENAKTHAFSLFLILLWQPLADQ